MASLTAPPQIDKGAKLVGQELALSIHSRYLQDKALLSRPVSALAKMAGFSVNDVYKKLLPALLDRDLGEALRFAEVALQYGNIVDKNRLREEVGESYILALEIVFSLVQSGLKSSENYIKRKAMMLHGKIIDEAAERTRFVEAIIGEQKYKMVQESLANIANLEAETLAFDRGVDGVYELTSEPAQ